MEDLPSVSLMFADFFIKRPVLASVCAIVMLIAGAVCLPLLSIEHYPDLSPVQISVTANYQGASADVVEKTVTSVLERQINGIEGLRDLTSSSSNEGTAQIIATFQPGRNQDLAAADVQNRVSFADSQLPDTVRQAGIRVHQQSSSIVLGMAIYSNQGQYDELFLSNYVDLYVLDRLKRVPGVGNVQTFGERRYAMRVWLDPTRLASRSLTAQDVVTALLEQNIQVGAGQIGQPPIKDDQMFQIDLVAQSRLTTKEEFEDVTLKAGSNGTLVKLKDVGRAELGAESYASFSRYNGLPCFGMSVFARSQSNVLEVAKAVKAEMNTLSKTFPPGMTYSIPYDPTLLVETSHNEAIKTLIEAFLLIVLTIFIFTQDWRTTLIAAMAVPISLMGTFALMKAFGVTFNRLSLSGLTLAVGFVVDDAILVIESIDRRINQGEMPPIQAASEAMKEVTGEIVVASLVLMAVFVPLAFFPGTIGALYKPFGLTTSFSVALSTLNALTLTPALAVILRREQNSGFSRRVNHRIAALRRTYQTALTFFVQVKYAVLSAFVVLLCFTGWIYVHTPVAFLPEEDQGYFIMMIQAPDGSSVNYTRNAIEKVENALKIIKNEVAGTFAVGGSNPISGNSDNNGMIFVPLMPWSERTKPEQQAIALINTVRDSLSNEPSGSVVTLMNPPIIPGLGSVDGFTFQLQDRGNQDIDKLVAAKDALITEANKQPELRGVLTTFSAKMPQLKIEVDRSKAKSLGVSISEVFGTLQTYLGGRYVNDFNLLGRSYRVYVQADNQFRSNPDQVGTLQVRSNRGRMISLSNLVKVTPATGARVINHYNLFPSIEISGTAAPGYSSKEAIKAMERAASTALPKDISYEWSGLSLEALTFGGLAPLIFGLGLGLAFLGLAARYENFVDPIVVLLAVPLTILGALVAQNLRGFTNDVYCQIGIVMLIGLASKNAVLMVEFANQLRNQGRSIPAAAIESAQFRFRPTLTTSLALMLGLMPLVFATGAGAISRRSLGTAVSGGLLVSLGLSLFIVPVLYVLITSTREIIVSRFQQRSIKPQTPNKSE